MTDGGAPPRARVLVTGADGYLGTSVVRRLCEAGCEVLGLTRRPAGAARRADGARPVRGDVRDARGLAAMVREERIDAICHLAALTRTADSRRDPLGYFATNVQGTVNVLGALTGRGRAGPARLVFVSTCAVYRPGSGTPAREDDPLGPDTPYAASKRAAEEVIGFQAATGSLGAVTLRCVNIAGADGRPDPDPARLVPRTLLAATGRVPALTVAGDGSAVREFVHVDDVARACVAALEGCCAGEHAVFNVGSGTGVSVREVVAAAEELTGRRVPVVHREGGGGPAVLRADSRRIRDRLGWRPRRSAIGQILADTLAAGLPEP
ncbi:SDR family NAD(P)-dependent oxidoreductase [Streptomyces sp. NPDC053048]|uniref:SDR family NAD(P)-dependent oxidoreductase n=1 Tax=Streptomyces sp. NPDC053048 TaxID=3365694 RepID=UPI0037D2699A